MKFKPISNIETAIRIYYEHPEIGHKQFSELFKGIAKSTVCRYMSEIRKVQAERNIKTCTVHSVNTRTAYEVMGIDVDDLEHRLAKLKKLGMR